MARIQDILKARPRAEWLSVFAEARVPAGPINRVDEVAGDAALQARGLFFGLEDGAGRVVPQIGLGIQVDGASCVPRGLPPLLPAVLPDRALFLKAPAFQGHRHM